MKLIVNGVIYNIRLLVPILLSGMWRHWSMEPECWAQNFTTNLITIRQSQIVWMGLMVSASVRRNQDYYLSTLAPHGCQAEVEVHSWEVGI